MLRFSENTTPPEPVEERSLDPEVDEVILYYLRTGEAIGGLYLPAGGDPVPW